MIYTSIGINTLKSTSNNLCASYAHILHLVATPRSREEPKSYLNALSETEQHELKFQMTTKPIYWNPEKNRKLIEERSISFEAIIFSMQSGGLLDDIAHPNANSYAHQRVFIVTIDDYVYLVPYVESETDIFLKTIIPSRKATKSYLGAKL